VVKETMVSMMMGAILKKMADAIKGGDPLPTENNVEQSRAGMEKSVSIMKPPKGVAFAPVDMSGVPAERASTKRAPRDRALMYLHGGAYCIGSITSHHAIVGKLASMLGIQAFNVGYRLAPEHPFPAALDDAILAYKWLLEHGSIPSKGLVIAGDSAGGGLTIATLMRIRDEGLPPPKAAFCFSPWTDLAITGETMETKANVDVMLTRAGVARCAGFYAAGNDRTNPLVSPLYGKCEGLPPVFIQVGTSEILLADSTRMAQKLKDAGCQVQLDVWEHMFHVFVTMACIPFIGPLIPECSGALKNIKRFVNGQFSA
jgi:monoterpene epsilon-lactone hydrolase